MIGPVTPEITRVTTAPFWTRRQKNGISHQISQQLYKTDLHQLFSISRHMYGDYKADISFAEAQGTWLMVTN